MPNAASRSLDASKKVEAAQTDSDKLRALQEYLGVMPKHKGTENDRAMVRRKIALLRDKVQKSQAKKGQSISVKKEGIAQAVLVGFPNAGKSSLLSKLTRANPKVAAYPFTTIQPMSGMIDYSGFQIQLVDLPGLISGAAEGKGMGKQFLSVIRTADLIIYLLDVSDKPLERLKVLMDEFEIAGIKLNKRPADVKIYKRDKGGIEFSGTAFLKCDEEQAKAALRDLGYVNCNVRLNSDVTLDELIDAIDRSIAWSRGIVILNKIDLVKNYKDVETRIRQMGFKVYAVSAETRKNMDDVKEAIWQTCDFMRIYTENDGVPVIVRSRSTAIEVAGKIHKHFAENFKFARVWGKSVRYEGQRVGKEHILQDGDLVKFG